MSRFFETLRELSRSSVVSNGAPSEEKGEESGTDGFTNFPLMDLSPDAATSESADEPLGSRFFGGGFLDAFAPRRNGMASKTVNVAIERKVPLIPHTTDNSIVEHYRRLRTKIQQQHATKPIRSLLVTSPGQGEGKTVTVVNLGLSFAMLPDFKVLVIDGDLRRGTIGKWFGISNLPGLSNLIDGTAQIDEVLFKSEHLQMHCMLSGTSERPAAELLASPILGETIRRASENFDLVLVDSPPVNLIADAQMLAGSCDGVLLIARAFSTTNVDFEKTMKDLLPFRIVGTVLNAGMPARRHYYRYGY
jgi:capsular exopolysaccharide synthesis family protein